MNASSVSVIPLLRTSIMQRSLNFAGQLVKRRGFSTNSEKIVAAVLFERLPVVIPKIDPVIYAFTDFQFRWQQQYRRKYPDEFLNKADGRGKGDYQIDYVPAPRITEADKTNDRKSLKRALDRRLYLLLYGPSIGAPDEKPIWHFPEKAYETEETLRKCAESALKSVLGDLSQTYFVGNAPMGHMVVPPTETAPVPTLKRFFFKSQVVAADKFDIGKCEDFVWVTKDELLEHFPDQAEFFKKMIIS
ncbi:39S ribosomal protein L46, mitochondrial isoform X2 [Cucumis sativus]|uniref:39S ribosomal protein L46, mitochondrial isoform X2 n=1 Tax=Cucumis sativus TaxID=3659 RepID=UPI0005ECFA4D|nr:39S ribosomal protein L46, mitochondrial isoform X2 [Cucumis sativus]